MELTETTEKTAFKDRVGMPDLPVLQAHQVHLVAHKVQ
jgi:hypothetical protein